MYWIYHALTASGQEVTASFSGTRKEVLIYLSDNKLHLIETHPDFQRLCHFKFVTHKPSALALASFFEDFHNMLETGMSVPQIVLILKESNREQSLEAVFLKLDRELQEGKSLAEIFCDLKIFHWIVGVTLSAGERTGKLSQSTGILGQYFRQSHQIQNKMKQALIYPVIVFVLLISLMLFVSIKVIPQLKNLLPMDALHNPSTQWIITSSSLVQQYFWLLLIIIPLHIFGIYFFQNKNRLIFEQWLYGQPVIGGILKESALSLYLLNLSVLLKSGVPLLKAIEDLSLLDPTPVAKHFNNGRDYMLGGLSLWQSIQQDSFFPRIIASTFRRAEEMAKIEDYCQTLSEYFSNRASSKIDGLIHIIQPTLLAIGGMFLVIIALAFLLPLYGSLSTIAGGQ